MGRPAGPKIRCSGQWTEARFNSFITSLLRQGTRRWAPIQQVKKEANVGYGQYLCALCKEVVPPTVKVGRARKQNIFVDHINPITDPTKGFESWDKTINGMFCEKDNLQLLCGRCHDEKTTAERALAVENRRKRNG